MLVYTAGAGITAAAGTRLALQLILAVGFGYHPSQNLSGIAPMQVAILRRCLTRGVSIGQFARLLPSLVVVAISQAASPESNPCSPLPVSAIARPSRTV